MLQQVKALLLWYQRLEHWYTLHLHHITNQIFGTPDNLERCILTCVFVAQRSALSHEAQPRHYFYRFFLSPPRLSLLTRPMSQHR
jgi:hypothetical protein